MFQLPANINIAKARLPQVYESARTALAECVSIDECKDWADKAQALASYARQADDDTLHKMANRIQARAVRRCGELLQTFKTGPKGGRPNKNSTPGDTVSQRQAANGAGMSKKREVTAVRVANVPSEEFEQLVESDDPPTVTQIAQFGTGTAPPGFKQATAVLGTLKRFSEFCAENEPELVAGGLYDYEIAEAKQMVSVIDAWLDRFVVNLGDEE